jgi:hypothetical protein
MHHYCLKCEKRIWHHGLCSDCGYVPTKEQCSKGGKGYTKLTRRKVLNIREQIKKGMKQKDIAKRHGVSCAAISDINTGKTWGWLE